MVFRCRVSTIFVLYAIKLFSILERFWFDTWYLSSLIYSPNAHLGHLNLSKTTIRSRMASITILLALKCDERRDGKRNKNGTNCRSISNLFSSP